MLLHCTLVAGPNSALESPSQELTVVLSSGAQGIDLQDALGIRFGTDELFVAGQPVVDSVPGKFPLLDGAILVDGLQITTGSGQDASSSASPLVLAVHSGADSGKIFRLSRGTFTLGRAGSDLQVLDPSISRFHARFTVSETHVRLRDLNSSNGTFVDEHRITEAPVSTQSRIRCGVVQLSLCFDGGWQTDAAVPPMAASELPRDTGPLVVTNVQLPPRRALVLLAVGLPVIAGAGIATFTGMWVFFAFAAVTGIMMALPLVLGRSEQQRFAASLDDATTRDAERRRLSSPSAADVVMGKFRVAGHPAGVCPGPLFRIGRADQPANIILDPPTPHRDIPTLELLPVILKFPLECLTVRGTVQTQNGFLRSLLLQKDALPGGPCSEVIIAGPASTLPLAARFFPGVVLVAAPGQVMERLRHGPQPGACRGVLVILPGEDSTGDEMLAMAGRASGWSVLRMVPVSAEPAAHDIVLTEESAVFTDGSRSLTLLPDFVSDAVFDAYARRSHTLTPRVQKGASQMCGDASFESLVDADPDSVAARWAGPQRPGLVAVLGVQTSGPITFDFEADGPHLLIAGTTGAGKSELLRTMAGSLALTYPPLRINFLFLDFKGGSGLGVLAGLPHCVGLLTDLSSSEIDRFLRSLHAEVLRREHTLARARCTDAESYRDQRMSLESAGPGEAWEPLPQLIVMVDEFRVLMDEAPAALRELLRIASVGRSLGIHLVMATQRPQGAVTADIQANVTSRIALRVQSAAESVDIIGSALASTIAVNRPGRAYLVRGSGASEEFQTVPLTMPVVRTTQSATQEVYLAASFVGRVKLPSDEKDRTAATSAAAAESLSLRLTEVWSQIGGWQMRKPVADPLPGSLPYTHPALSPCHDIAEVHPDSPADPLGINLPLGWLDLPRLQRVSLFTFVPVIHGHLALIGYGPAVDDAMDMIVHRSLHQDNESHLYILDAGGTLVQTHEPRIGAAAGLEEMERAARIIMRLHAEMRIRITASSPPAVPLLVVIKGWGSWVSAWQTPTLQSVADLVHDIVRDGLGAQIFIVISGGRELTAARFLSSVANHIYFPGNAPREALLGWPQLPHRANPAHCVAFGPAAHDGPASCVIYDKAQGDLFSLGACSSEPFRIDALPCRLSVPELQNLADANPRAAAAADVSSAGYASLLVGIGGDTATPVYVDIPIGGIMAVVGSRGTGKTATLRSFVALNPKVKFTWIQPPACGASMAPLPQPISSIGNAHTPHEVFLIDDAHRLTPAMRLDVARLTAAGLQLIFTMDPDASMGYVDPLVLAARVQGRGLVLLPKSPQDGELFNSKLTVEPSPPQGRAALILRNITTTVQVAWDGAPDTDKG